MKKLISSLILLCALVGFSGATTSLLSSSNENGHSYKVMKVILDGKSKVVVAAVNNYTPPQTLKTLMTNAGGTHAINGGFYCAAGYSWCEENTTDGLRITDGILYSKRGKDIAQGRTVFGFDEEGTPLPMAVRDERYRENGGWENKKLEPMKNGMMMPTLVMEGVNVAINNDEMNNDPKQGKAGSKTFICSVEDNSIVYMGFVDNVTFSSIADYIIETFDCYNAILLDGGGTRAMINNGSYAVGPGRAMMDAFVVVEGKNIGAKIAPITTEDDEMPMPTLPLVDTSNEELENAVTWMYNAGLTSKATVDDFLPNNTMTRQEASKFFSVFAENEFQKKENSSLSCNFKDTLKTEITLRSSVTHACKMGIFKGYNGYFSPLDKLTNAQAITVLMRIMVGQMKEPTTAFYTNYFLKAKEFGLVENILVNNNITRGEAAILLYKASIYREELED